MYISSGVLVYPFEMVSDLFVFLKAVLSDDAKCRREGVVAIDSCVGRFSEGNAGGVVGKGASFGADASFGSGARTDTVRATPLERWDVDSAAPAVSHKPGARFGRCAVFSYVVSHLLGFHRVSRSLKLMPVAAMSRKL